MLGQRIVQEKNCRTCHRISGRGASGPGPNLDRVTERRTQEWLRRWLRDPQAIEPGTLMPTFGFTDPEIDALIAFLRSLRTAGAAASGSGGARGDKAAAGLPPVKSWLTVGLVGLSLVAVWSMFERLGRSPRAWVGRDAALLIHRVNGYLFAAIALVITQFCVRMLVARDGGEWSPRVTMHVSVGVIAIVVLGVKIVLARRYSAGLGDILPPLGILLVIATWVLAVGSAGYWFALAAHH